MQTNFKSTYQTFIKAPVNKVWEALVNPEMVREYFFGSSQITDWKVGSPIIWEGEYEGKKYQDKGVVLEYIPNDTLSFSYLSNWAGLPDQPENYLFVKYEVTQVEGGTKLSITQSNYDEGKAKHSAENWAVVIDGLKKLVE
ncbi:SRPBCC domain-containing protein [Chryseolinea sp. H1M3-3]|uniref:SRPBCC domain-containing protein n=1 Tax=Chryseolinea sp. H1M3-3 TaxID=3034144 RepID=UPI0023EA8365|nr:SRPBCC domain-containing protein [Chryseolinea sp. H1M3-3]